MQVTLTIFRYPRRYTYFALLAMALHRLPLSFNKHISFYKLLGTGRNGSFDIHPDWQQWGIFAVSQQAAPANLAGHELIGALYGKWLGKWVRLFNCETWTIFLEPLEGHGLWDKEQPFGDLTHKTGYPGPVAVLTRATIRLSKLRAFWKNVDGVAKHMAGAEGLLTSIGIGELPLIKQATFSVWEDMETMKSFAYRLGDHTNVIRKTRQENWYKEEMFVRFKPVRTSGTIKGNDPLAGKI